MEKDTTKKASTLCDTELKSIDATMRMVASVLFISVSHNVEAFLIVSFSISHFFVIFYWFIRLKLVLKI